MFYKKEGAEGEAKKRAADIILEKLFSLTMFFQDIAFFAVFGGGVAIINYYYNNGRFRVYAPLAAFLGFFIYYISLGAVWRKIHNSVALALRRLVLIILAIVLKPFMFFFTFFGKTVKNIGINVYKTIAKIQKKVYNNNKAKQIGKKATFGFVEPLKSSIRGKENGK